MELKTYQKKVIEDLQSYLRSLHSGANLADAWKIYWQEKDIAVAPGGAPAYKNIVEGAPAVCLKVPTGGGKTFLACNAIKPIFNFMPQEKPKLVVWLTPSDAILEQTLKNLRAPGHPYKQFLDRDFGGRVQVLDKNMLLSGQNFSVDALQSQLTVCVLSFDSLRINSDRRCDRKIYQENGNLASFAAFYKDDDILLAGTPETALIQVLRHLRPVVVVDESHNATSPLSVEMLQNIYPSFILELTATPRKNSNVLSYVDARALKNENMVKLPVIVYKRNSRESVIADAIQFRGKLEQKALEEEAATGDYIRPIVLFQAQPKNNHDNTTFDKIKEILLDIGIPQEQIAIKTSEKNELKSIDLLSKDCPVRYIITVNALKEGWDCPFAYILASLANKTSSVDVEQILGRVLRQPYARQRQHFLLNSSYVFSCSNDFRRTLDSIVAGLNGAGFSRSDYRVGSDGATQSQEQARTEQQNLFIEPSQENGDDTADNFADVSPQSVKEQVDTARQDNARWQEMEAQAERQTQEYEAENNSADFMQGEEAQMQRRFKIRDDNLITAKGLHIPQFCIKSEPDLFDNNTYVYLEPENLLDGFCLTGQDANVDFKFASGEMYSVDIAKSGEAVPQYRMVTQSDKQKLRAYLDSLPQDRQIETCIGAICDIINHNNAYESAEIKDYVRRVVAGLHNDDLTALLTSKEFYVKKIREKIDSLAAAYSKRKFAQLMDAGEIECCEHYVLPDFITPINFIDALPKSLYEAEKDDMNELERKVLDVIISNDNIVWWHRISERQGFCINGFIKHYPDFMAFTKTGKLLLIEAKGEHLANEDSRNKLLLGRKWQEAAGRDYRYLMVFAQNGLQLDGSYNLDEFANVIAKL
ncbi:MAG: DEAD/DEAH box helicase family protein [Phascolarctobacterium sp.]|uniref:DEAD/DEAH box helicase n=1 Tax=Phascolarctobacterium sp. TaxID=2049039 RepID=UPI0026DBB624|nr:DEAD/DEAH box helicase family protein [Phascolarctobacterium sp.]MDO4921453.1 DEAD/DEAH box helicase family protein [Phascolarctobacterium sp.]